MPVSATYSADNEVFAAFLKYGSVVVVKMVLMSAVTGFYRLAYKSLATEEDVVAASRLAGNEKLKEKLLKPSAEVERVLAAHRNDIENIVPFASLALMYIATNPDPATAILLFKVYAFSRILHTFVYLGKVRQPARLLCFVVGYGINLYMGLKTMIAFW